MRLETAAHKPTAALPARLLEAPAVLFIATHRWLLVGVPWLLLRYLQLFLVAPNSDVQRYFEAASQWLHHAVPYRDFLLEYPPGALLLFTLPRLCSDNFRVYSSLFAGLMLMVDVAILTLLVALPRRMAQSPSPLPHKSSIEPLQVLYDTNVGLMAYVGLSSLLLALGLERYDLSMALCLLALLYTAMDHRQPWRGDLLLCLGVWLKLIPLLVTPIYLVYLYASSADMSPAFYYKQLPDVGTWLRRAGAWHLARLCGFTLLLFGPFYAMAGDGFWTFLHYHQVRGLQIESLYAGWLAWVHDYSGDALSFTPAFGAAELVNPQPNSIRGWANASSVFIVLSALGISAWFAQHMLRATRQAQRNYLLCNATFALLVSTIALNKVLSPQYLLWLAPLVAVAFLNNPQQRRQVLLGTTLATFFTTLLWQFYYRNLLGFEPMAVYLLLGRNGLLLGLLWQTLQPGGVAAASSDIDAAPGHALEEAVPSPPRLSAITYLASLAAALGRFFAHPAWAYVAVGLSAAWMFIANLSETTANDIWIQMRSGADIWHSGAFPSTEVYSATVLNRSFIAHEWLTSLIFYGLTVAFGDAGLSFLAAFVALAAFVLLYFSQPPSVRRSWFYGVLLMVTCYLVSFRILVRPHIFTIVAQAALVLLLERWRRNPSRKAWRELLILLPMQLVWVNLHGAAFFGPALLWMMTALVALLVLLPTLQQSETRRFAWADVGIMAAFATGTSLTCCINPYGLDLLRFSLDLLNNDYVKARVWEWTSPLLSSNLAYYWLWLYVSVLLTLWISLLIRWRSLPLIDAAWTLMVTFLSLRANRFVPDFAIFAFPVIARSCTLLSNVALHPARQRRLPWLDIGLATLLIANAVTYGYAHSAFEHRPKLGWGFGGDMPYQEVDLLKKMHLSGVIFNEYSDGALIIHSLVPQIRPVLDSRIDLYPFDVVEEYDRAYTNVEYFRMYVRQHHINLVMLIVNRAQPPLLAYLAREPSWELLAKTNGRVLYRKVDEADATTQHNTSVTAPARLY